MLIIHDVSVSKILFLHVHAKTLLMSSAEAGPD